eukprot:5283259-Pyramimonas_sp.AAC.1
MRPRLWTRRSRSSSAWLVRAGTVWSLATRCAAEGPERNASACTALLPLFVDFALMFSALLFVRRVHALVERLYLMRTLERY